MPDFDMIVIGAGAAGLSVTSVAAQLGLAVALIERGQMGGDCLNNGCVPSKAMLAASSVMPNAERASLFGVRSGRSTVDWDAVHAHVRDVIAGIAPMDSEERFRALGATVLRGESRFTNKDTLTIDGRSISARRIVIAAGSRPVIPAIPGLADFAYVTNETLFELPKRPEHLLILGGGPIGLEMAQAHAGLGSRVTIIEGGEIAGREEPELVAVIRESLRGRGIDIRERRKVIRVESGPTLILEDGARIAGSHLLVAVGRRPNIEALAADRGGIATTVRGIATDLGLRSITNKRVFAAGDIADPVGLGPRYFTHVGSYHASLVVRRALFRMPARLDYSALPRVTYTDPELAQVGMTEAEAKAVGKAFKVLRWSVGENDRGRAERQAHGLAKLIVTPSGRVLGAGFAAPHAGEMIGAWSLAIARKIPLTTMASMIVPYPTYAEMGKRAAGSFFVPRLFSPLSRRLARLLSRLP